MSTPEQLKNELAQAQRQIQELTNKFNQNFTQKISTPKVEIPKLSTRKYVDWALKMECALKMYDLWIDPNSNIDTLSESAKAKNEKAALFLACHLDEFNAPFINETTKKCFVTAWKHIKQFHEPRAATILTDIFIKIKKLNYEDGQPIELHLMKLEQQFKRFTEAQQTLSEDFQVAITLASVSNSRDFDSVFQSASWEEKADLTMAKIKSVLITTQRRTKHENNQLAHHANFRYQQKKITRSNKVSAFTKQQHNRQPRDPVKGWECPTCEMDNHKSINCSRKRYNNPQISNHKPKANQTSHSDSFNADGNADGTEHLANVAQAYSSRFKFRSPKRPLPYDLPATPGRNIKTECSSTNAKSSRTKQTNQRDPYEDILDFEIDSYDMTEADESALLEG